MVRTLEEINYEIKLCNEQMIKITGENMSGEIQDMTRRLLGELTGPVMEALEKRLVELNIEKENTYGR